MFRCDIGIVRAHYADDLVEGKGCEVYGAIDRDGGYTKADFDEMIPENYPNVKVKTIVGKYSFGSGA